MAKPLVIVESPAKAKTISQFLGNDFTVEASVGHIRDLPSKGLSIDVDADFATDYEVNPDKRDVIKRLKALLKDADELYLATDEDREGEAIAWHLKEVLKPKVPVKRMVFHEITRSAIEHAVENSRDIDCCMHEGNKEPGSHPQNPKLYGLPALLTHFQSVHLQHDKHDVASNFREKNIIPDWKVDMVALPDLKTLKSLPHNPGMDEFKLRIIAQALPGVFSTSLSELPPETFLTKRSPAVHHAHMADQIGRAHV